MRIKFFNIETGKVKSEKGFTLVELIIVTIVTSIISSSLILPFLSSIKNGTQPEIYNTASYLAVEEIERIKSEGYSVATGSIGTDMPVHPDIKGRTYNYEIVTEYVTNSAGSFSNSATPTEFIRATVTLGNANIPNDIVLWEILPKDFYDKNANE